MKWFIAKWEIHRSENNVGVDSYTSNTNFKLKLYNLSKNLYIILEIKTYCKVYNELANFTDFDFFKKMINQWIVRVEGYFIDLSDE